MLKLYNTLTKKIEEFKPIGPKEVRMYTCGPTVYNFAHIGNLRTYIFEDVLRRVLLYNGYTVNHAMNITDVGHLVGDGDEGEDKMEIGAKREHKDPREITEYYSKQFFLNSADLNILYPSEVAKASDAIAEEIEIIKILEQKGFIYVGEHAIYFDTSKFANYGLLARQKLNEKKVGARKEVVVDKEKKHPADFALWFFLVGRNKNHIMRWPSPWGEGFPGWHIECSAISRKLLGQPFDIHCGGVDHIGTHHANEIAQSEAAFGVPLANFWMHGEFLQINTSKMAKSAGTFITLKDLIDKGFSPLDYRYLCLTAHYRTQLNFTWKALAAAHNALEKLYSFASLNKAGQIGCADYEQKFLEAVNDDLNTPQALAVVWQLIDDKYMPAQAKLNSLLKFDKVLGLNLAESPAIIKTPLPAVPGQVILSFEHLPDHVIQDIASSAVARLRSDFKTSDEARKKVQDEGYDVENIPEGFKVKKKPKI